MKTYQQLQHYRGHMLKTTPYWEKIIRRNLKPVYKPKVTLLRQVIIGTFIVDFVVLPKMLIIEFDGKIHDQTVTYDRFRDGLLTEWGFRVIHIRFYDVDNVFNKVQSYEDIPDYEERFKDALRQATAYRRACLKKARPGHAIKEPGGTQTG